MKWLLGAFMLFALPVLQQLLAQGVAEWAAEWAEYVVRFAARMVPAPQRERHQDEWLAELDALGDSKNVSKLGLSLRILLFAPKTWAELRGYLPDRLPAAAPTGLHAGPLPARPARPAGRPHVTALVVCREGGMLLRETMHAVAEQTRRADQIVFIDAGLSDGSADWLRRRHGPEAVITAKGSFSRAVTIALLDQRIADTDWVWLLHDDAAPARTALRELESAAHSAPEVSIFGPMLVDWDEPSRIRDVGWWVDLTGHQVSIVTPYEVLDQGQHDDGPYVFGVSTPGMFVRRAALLAAGGFDGDSSPYGDALDLCWRIRLLGGQVRVVPAAKVRHHACSERLGRCALPTGDAVYHRERDVLASMLRSMPLRRLPDALMIAMVEMMFRVAGLVLTGRSAKAARILRAWGWNAKVLPRTLAVRRQRQRSHRLDHVSLRRGTVPVGVRWTRTTDRLRCRWQAVFPPKEPDPRWIHRGW